MRHQLMHHLPICIKQRRDERLGRKWPQIINLLTDPNKPNRHMTTTGDIKQHPAFGRTV